MSSTPPDFTRLRDCKDYVADLVARNHIEPKKTVAQFLWGECLALLAQTLVFGMAFALATNFFDDKAKAARIFASKIGGESASEFWMLGFGLLVVMGVLAFASKALPTIRHGIDDFAFELPRAIYAFGASSAAACACMAIYMRKNPGENLGPSVGEVAWIGVGFLLVCFLYGAAISYAFKRHALK